MGTLKQIQMVGGVLVMLVGVVKCTMLASSLLRFIWRHFLRPGQDLKQYGKWAVVTGATDGIGREYCNFLAARGEDPYNIAHRESD
jgi:17beta-estradiol 17-dehydrogenase / very-long-chain 3-oxoacyl-CoA reductase